MLEKIFWQLCLALELICYSHYAWWMKTVLKQYALLLSLKKKLQTLNTYLAIASLTLLFASPR